MSNLGAFGSSDYSPAQSQPEQQQPGSIQATDPQFSALSQVTALFQSTNSADQTVAMKMLIALMSKGHDVSEFAALVVKEVASPDPLCRHLAYIFLTQYAHKQPEIAVMCINTFQRALKDSDPMTRALAIKVLSSIGIPKNLPDIKDAVEQVSGDPSPYVKKAAAYAIIKACEADPEQIQDYIPIIKRLLEDQSPIAFSGAIAAYWTLCPDNIDLLHPIYRFMCQNIRKYDEWTQIYILRSLTIYSRYCFKNPDLGEEDETGAAFWDENAQKDMISGDHILLIHAAKQCLNSPNPAVVMAAVSFIFYAAPATNITSVARPLVRLLYEAPLTAQLALTSILTIASVHSHIFVPHLNHFFVRKTDASEVKQLKLRVLSMLASPSNAEMVLNELSMYTGSTDTEFAATAVKTMGKTAMLNEDIVSQCLVSLLRLMGRAEGQVLSEVVLVIAHILRKRRGTDDEAFSLRQLCRKFLVIKDPGARSAVLSIVGDMHETHPEFAPQLLRHIAQNFADEPSEVRLQALTLAAKLLAVGTTSEVPMYLLKIGARDSEFDVRDRARFLSALIHTKNNEIHSRLKELLFPPRKPPTWTHSDDARREFQIGTFSHFHNKSVGPYDPLPEWAEESELPPDSVRLPLRALSNGKENIDMGDNDNSDDLDINNFFGNSDEEEEKVYYSENEEEAEYEYEEEEDAAEEEVQEAQDDEDIDDFFN